MGLNTIHNTSKDLITCYNETQKRFFKCELLGEKASRALEVIKGLEMFAITMTIKVNGKSTINEKDKITIMGKTFQCNAISSSYDNQEQFRKRADFNEFTGSTLIGLI